MFCESQERFSRARKRAGPKWSAQAHFSKTRLLIIAGSLLHSRLRSMSDRRSLVFCPGLSGPNANRPRLRCSASYGSSFDAVVVSVSEQLRARDFGTLADIDVQATLKAKLGVEMPKYRILGTC